MSPTIAAMRCPFAAAGIAGLLACAGAAHAAGGHFDVDDAAVLGPDRCQVEVWGLRVDGTTRGHVGPACRVGPVELGLNVDRAPGRTTLGPQVKWVVDPLVDKLSAGVVWSVAWDRSQAARPAHTLYVPLTLWATEKLALHGNAGVDRDADGRRWRRLGASGEWVASDRFSLIAERVKIVGDWTTRVGGRVSLSDTLSADLSAARIGPRASRVYAIGLNQEFAR